MWYVNTNPQGQNIVFTYSGTGTVSIHYYDFGSNTDMGSIGLPIVNYIPTSIVETETFDIKIYPNPTNDNITINFGSNLLTMTGYTLKITNSLNQTMFTTLVNQQIYSVDLNKWTDNGIYFFRLIDAQSNTIGIRKIILQ